MFQIIEDKLAIEGIQQYQYNFLSEGSHQSNTFNSESSWQVIDVRDLYDDDSNSLEDYDKKINHVWNAIQDYGKAVICCVAGISRSNAIALGVLVKYFHMDFYEASELVEEKVPQANISPVHIEKLKKLFKVTLP